MERRRNPTTIDHLRDHLDRIWDHVMQGGPQQPGYCGPGFEPRADLLQTDTEVIVLIELSGLRGSELDILIEGQRLTVRGVKQEPPRPEGARYIQMEIVAGAFERTLELPTEVTAEGATVQYANGFLELHLPMVLRPADLHVRIPVRRV